MKIITDPRCIEYGKASRRERPQRISRTVERLQQPGVLTASWVVPEAASLEVCLRAHTPGLLEQIRAGVGLDRETPAHEGMFDHALRAVGGAVHAMEAARAGECAFSLMRPPGHHATSSRTMGYCYLNNVAVAVLQARFLGSRRVAVLDFDVHHGNGTEAILLNQDGLAYFSIHEHPAYPDTGAESIANAYNYPLPAGTSREDFRTAWQKLLGEVGRFQPELIGVSAGFDMYKADPLGHQQLEIEDFQWLGTTIKQLRVPHFSVLEGGYSDQLPELVLAYCQGLSQ
jgi:acetoin utilization deacetylase AcuC-like enzyme